MIRFELVPPADIHALPIQAVKYLERAILRTPASTSNLDFTLQVASKGFGAVYLVFDDDKLTGATYILTYDTSEGKIISPVLVGGKNMERWRKEYWDFIFGLGVDSKSSFSRFISRTGWKKRYPKCRVIGYIYEYKFP